MKFLCSHCKAKYQIADEKVAGRTLRMTCRNCQQEIMIRGDVPAPAPAPPPARRLPAPVQAPAPLSALAADFQRQVGASLHAPPLPSLLDEWHVGINDVPVGPMRREEVARKLAAGAIHPDSLAWREGLDDWLPIRNIAELAVLCVPGMSMTPPPLLSAAQRSEFAPVGGRAGAMPSYAVEDWAQVSAEPPSPQPQPQPHVSISPMMSADFVERRGGMPSVSVMFALAGGLAFLMTLSAIFGARWLQGGQNASATKADALAVAPVSAPSPAVAQPAPALAPAAAPTAEMVIGLDDPALAGDGRNGAHPRVAAPQPGKASSSGNGKKELTEEQKAMLARMGGGDAPSNLNLRSQTGPGAGDQRAGTGTLSAKDVSDVVVRGRPNLQRCYETALRGSGSTDTVRIGVELTVSAAGNVSSVKTSGEGPPGMAQCIERTVHMWRFPKSADESPVKFPLVFQPGS